MGRANHVGQHVQILRDNRRAQGKWWPICRTKFSFIFASPHIVVDWRYFHYLAKYVMRIITISGEHSTRKQRSTTVCRSECCMAMMSSSDVAEWAHWNGDVSHKLEYYYAPWLPLATFARGVGRRCCNCNWLAVKYVVEYRVNSPIIGIVIGLENVSTRLKIDGDWTSQVWLYRMPVNQYVLQQSTTPEL